MEALGIVLIVGFIYFVPSVAANYLEHKNTSAIFLLNLLLGWTLLGWIGALVWAFCGEQPEPKKSAKPTSDDEDRIKCPECAEKILKEASKCRFCGAVIQKPL